MKLQKKVNKLEFYTDYVNILNGVLQLSPREAEVFSRLLYYDANGFEDNVNHKSVRDQVKSILGISEANLSRYLSTIKIKGLIIKGPDNKWVINSNIRPIINDSQMEISFTLNIQEDEHKEDMGQAINSVYTKNI